MKFTRTQLQRFQALLKEARSHWKSHGIRGVFQRFGWKLVAIVFTYYLVRDLTLYVVIPYFFLNRALN